MILAYPDMGFFAIFPMIFLVIFLFSKTLDGALYAFVRVSQWLVFLIVGAIVLIIASIKGWSVDSTILALALGAILLIMRQWGEKESASIEKVSTEESHSTPLKIQSVEVDKDVNVSVTFDETILTVTLVLENPDTKVQSQAIILPLSSIDADAGRKKEFFYEGNIEVIQIKKGSGFEIEVKVTHPEHFFRAD